MILYAIKEKITGEFYTRFGKLDELGIETELYPSHETALNAIQGSVLDLGRIYCPVKRHIYEILVERELIRPRVCIYDILDSVDLEVVEIRLNEVKHKNAK